MRAEPGYISVQVSLLYSILLPAGLFLLSSTYLVRKYFNKVIRKNILTENISGRPLPRGPAEGEERGRSEEGADGAGEFWLRGGQWDQSDLNTDSERQQQQVK